MSIGYRNRQKRIRDEKKRREAYPINELDFAYLQASWGREIDGPPLGTLEELR